VWFGTMVPILDFARYVGRQVTLFRTNKNVQKKHESKVKGVLRNAKDKTTTTMHMKQRHIRNDTYKCEKWSNGSAVALFRGDFSWFGACRCRRTRPNGGHTDRNGAKLWVTSNSEPGLRSEAEAAR